MDAAKGSVQNPRQKGLIMESNQVNMSEVVAEEQAAKKAKRAAGKAVAQVAKSVKPAKAPADKPEVEVTAKQALICKALGDRKSVSTVDLACETEIVGMSIPGIVASLKKAGLATTERIKGMTFVTLTKTGRTFA